MTNKSNSFYKRTTILLPLLLLSLGLIFTVSINNVSAAPGDTIYVNGSIGNDASDGSSWILAKKSIKNATDNVNNNGKVNIADGQYKGINNTNITITKNMNIIGQSQTGTIINGTGTNWIFYIPNGVTVTINNLTLTNATTTTIGGAINNRGTMTVTGSTFTGNTATNGGGGAIFNQGTMTVTGSTFTNNKATGDGGAINNQGTGTMTVTGSTFTNNNAYDGGAIYNSGTLNVTGSTFTNNNATNAGGAIINQETLNVTDTTFTSNSATNGYGGAIYNDGTLNVTGSTFNSNTANYGGAIFNSGTMTVNNSNFTDNAATYYGGAIYNDGTLNVTGSTFNSNTANYGGAISNEDGTLTVTNSTFTNNTATDNGGAITNQGTLNVTGSTFNSNTTNNGGAIANGGTITVNSSIFTGNTANDGGAIVTEGTMTVNNSTFTNNTATDNGGAISNYGITTVHFNRIVGNTATNYGGAIFNGQANINATCNWWGSNSGPTTGSLYNVQTEEYTPWLYLTFAASPLSIPDGSTSTLTASFNQVFDGTTITQIDPVLGHIPDGSPVTFTTDLGNVGSKSVVKYTLNGIATAILRADETAGIAHVNGITDSQTLNTEVNINPKSSLYLTITPSKTNPVTGETVIYTLKVGNKGLDMAKDVVMTYTIPQGLEFAGANVDTGLFTYNPTTRTITWTIGDVPVGDSNMWLSLHIIKAGNYLINPKLRTSTYDPTINQNTQSITFNATNPVPINPVNPVNPVPVNTVEAANIISMQDTGTPIVPLAIAVLSILGGLAANRRK